MHKICINMYKVNTLQINLSFQPLFVLLTSKCTPLSYPLVLWISSIFIIQRRHMSQIKNFTIPHTMSCEDA